MTEDQYFEYDKLRGMKERIERDILAFEDGDTILMALWRGIYVNLDYLHEQKEVILSAMRVRREIIIIKMQEL